MSGNGERTGRDPPGSETPREELPLPHAARSLGDVEWVTEVPDECARLYVPIISPRVNGSPLRGWIVSRHALACWVHWYGDRSGPCLRPRALCDGCEGGRGKRLYGYLAVIVPRQKLALLEVTAEALRQQPGLLSGVESYRGAGFTATRSGRGNQGRVILAITAPSPVGKEAVSGWEEDPDIRPLLGRVWGMRP